MDREPKFKFDLQGLIRTMITVGVVVGGYYQIISTINEKVSDNRREISILKTDLEQHKTSIRVYTIDELTERFVTRREWESNHKALRDDVKYIRDRLDLFLNKISEQRKF